MPPSPKLRLLADEREIVSYHAVVDCQLATSAPDSPAGISLHQIRVLLEGTSQKYCAALHFQDSIHFFHSVFTMGLQVYACTSKGVFNGDTYVKFNQSEFMFPILGLTDLSHFPEKVDHPGQIPTTLDLLANDDVPSFASLHAKKSIHVID